MIKFIKLFFNDVIKTKYQSKLILLFVLSIVVTIFDFVGFGSLIVFFISFGKPDFIEYFKFLPFASNLSLNSILIFASLILIFLFFLKMIISMYYIRQNLKITQNIYADLSLMLIRKYLSLPYILFSSKNTNDMTKLVMTDATHVSQIFNRSLTILSDIFLSISIIVVLLFINPVICLLIFVLLTSIFYIFKYFLTPYIHFFGSKAINVRSNMFKSMDEILRNYILNKSMNIENWYIKQHSKFLEIFTKNSIEGNFFSHLPKIIIEFILVLFAFIVFIYILISNSYEEHSALILLFFGFLIRLLPSFFKLLNSYNFIKLHIASLTNVNNDLSLEIEKYGNKKIIFNHHIYFKNIYFSYGDRLILNNFDFKIIKGKSYVFYGKSGSGKSTVVKLLLGLINPSQGCIYIDKEILNIDNVNSFRSYVGYVPQDVFLMHDSMLNNILLGRAMNKKKLHNAVNRAQLFSLVNKLPKGLDTNIGQNGFKISGGEKQRIGIARALYDDPELLILDEATSSINKSMEKFIIRDLLNQSRNQLTIISITHSDNIIGEFDFSYNFKVRA